MLTEDRARAILREGEVDVLGRMPWSSNATFLVNITDDDDELLAIYKPQRGERPLWDFPRGTLCHREVAAYEVSSALGWNIVPDTVLRDGPAGPGMMQRFTGLSQPSYSSHGAGAVGVRVSLQPFVDA